MRVSGSLFGGPNSLFWRFGSRDAANLSAGPGVAIREFKMAKGHGFADYLLFVEGHAVGAVEAKPAGHTLTGVEVQAKKYATGLPPALDAPLRPLPFLYLSTGVETRITNLLDPRPRSRRVFNFHRPETLKEWLDAKPLSAWIAENPGLAQVADKPGAGEGYAARLSTLRSRIQALPPVHIPHLWPNKVKAITNLEQSLRDDRPRALIQMATGSGKTFSPSPPYTGSSSTRRPAASSSSWTARTWAIRPRAHS